MEIIYSPFGELGDDEYKSVVEAKIREYKSRLVAFDKGPVEFQVRETNHGRGADLVTVTVTLTSLAGAAFFAIPTAHKKVREALEEWGRIRDELASLIEWISGNDRPSLPIEVLFLESVSDLAKAREVGEIEFLSACEIPTQNAYGFDDQKTYLIVFQDGNEIEIRAYDSYKQRLWSRRVSL